MSRALLIAGLLVAPALFAQTSIYTPEIHLGGANQPSTITVPPVVQLSAEPAEPQVSNAPPASTALLSSRHFDFIVSPLDSVTPGSMADGSISLGEYARRLRAQRQEARAKRTAPSQASPDSMSRPRK